MSLAYRLLYALGITPWEQIASLPAASEQISALFQREEAGRRPPYGQALDVGCGSGIWGVELAKRGWQVTGVDVVPKALRRARERAGQAGVEVRLVEGDVTKLRATGVGSGFRLLLDFGLFHDELTDEQRKAMGREVSAVAAPGATLLMLAWAPRRRGPLPRGAGRGDVEAAYPEWTVIDEDTFDPTGAPLYRYVRNADPRFYRLRRAYSNQWTRPKVRRVLAGPARGCRHPASGHVPPACFRMPCTGSHDRDAARRPAELPDGSTRRRSSRRSSTPPGFVTGR
jgi:ubiquinone/menaquinone biosynthesis C-methylase UbiE